MPMVCKRVTPHHWHQELQWCFHSKSPQQGRVPHKADLRTRSFALHWSHCFQRDVPLYKVSHQRPHSCFRCCVQKKLPASFTPPAVTETYRHNFCSFGAFIETSDGRELLFWTSVSSKAGSLIFYSIFFWFLNFFFLKKPPKIARFGIWFFSLDRKFQFSGFFGKMFVFS